MLPTTSLLLLVLALLMAQVENDVSLSMLELLP